MPALFRRFLLFFLCFTSSLVLAENTGFTTSHFSGSGNCATCHDGLTDTSGNDVSIVRDWSGSMMANATKDPLWQAKVATELARNPHLSSVLNDKCTQCHAPMANYELTEVQGNSIEIFGSSGVLNSNHALYDAAMNGVSCTLCHQISDDASLGTLNGFSGKYKLNHSKTIYGQYSDIFGQPMINNTGYTPAYAAHVSDSAMCATCHNLKTPYVDSQGNLLTTTAESEFPEQMPYTEWQQSIFDDAGSNPQSCQDCHMSTTTSRVSNRPNWLTAKSGFAKHNLVGANSIMLTLLKNNATTLGVDTRNIDENIILARDMLRSAASIEILSPVVSNGMLEARVKVNNLSGHKTPTAYPSRRMWIHFKVTDSNNTVVFESGRMNTDGSIAGADNDANQAIYEPHYNVITATDQVQIYETIMGDSDGNVTYTLLRGAQYLKDNRLTPKGFNKLNVPDDVAVRGAAFNDADFNLGSDEIVYRVPVSASGNLTITATLNYQTIAHGFLQDLYRDSQLQQVQTFKTLYTNQSLKHEQMATASTTVAGSITPAPVITFSANPVMINAGQSSTLNWSASNASSCTASGAWSGSRNTSGTASVTPTATSTYTLTCSGAGGNSSQSVTINVNAASPAPVVNLGATPASISRGGSITLTWSSSNASSCVASGGWSGNKATSGSQSLGLSAPATFTLTCSGSGGSSSKSLSYVARGRFWLDLKP